MKLREMRESGKPQKKVWQKEEHQNAPHKKHWYQKYQLNARPYRQSKTTGPKPEDYEKHILPQQSN